MSWINWFALKQPRYRIISRCKPDEACPKIKMQILLLISASKNLRSPNWQLRHRILSQEIFQKNKEK